jgi:hypothetical protein
VLNACTVVPALDVVAVVVVLNARDAVVELLVAKAGGAEVGRGNICPSPLMHTWFEVPCFTHGT